MLHAFRIIHFGLVLSAPIENIIKRMCPPILKLFFGVKSCWWQNSRNTPTSFREKKIFAWFVLKFTWWVDVSSWISNTAVHPNLYLAQSYVVTYIQFVFAKKTMDLEMLSIARCLMWCGVVWYFTMIELVYRCYMHLMLCSFQLQTNVDFSATKNRLKISGNEQRKKTVFISAIKSRCGTSYINK